MGYLYEITRRPEETGKVTEENFYDCLDILCADYISDIHGEQADYVRKNLLGFIKQNEGLVQDDGSFTISSRVKQDYFYKRFNEFKRIVQYLTLREFAEENIQALQKLLDDPMDNKVWFDGGIYTFDYWMREAPVNVPLYIGNVFYLH